MINHQVRFNGNNPCPCKDRNAFAQHKRLLHLHDNIQKKILDISYNIALFPEKKIELEKQKQYLEDFYK